MVNLRSKYFMRLALLQAAKVLGKTKTNPAVGCVIVKNNHLISADSTSFNGRPHAEHNALKLVKKKDKDISLFSTLEPCSHYGKTSPCINKILNKKIKKVFFSIKDPDIRTYNKSRKLLKKKGIYVIEGVLNNEIKNFYRSYIKYKKDRLPFVTCKLAISKDFYTINNSKNKWITNEYSRGRVHLIRANHDCILSTSSSIIKDNSRLDCRIDGLLSRSPSKVILDKKLVTPINSRIFKNSHKFKTYVFYNKINKRKIKYFNKINVKHFKIPLDKNNNLNLKDCLIKIKKLGFNRIMVESGLTLINSFLKDKLVDDFKLFISNKKLKKKGKASFRNIFNSFFKKRRKSIEKINLLGDKLISYNFK